MPDGFFVAILALQQSREEGLILGVLAGMRQGFFQRRQPSATAPRSTCMRASNIAKLACSGRLLTPPATPALRPRHACFPAATPQRLACRIVPRVQTQCRLISRNRFGYAPLLSQLNALRYSASACCAD